MPIEPARRLAALGFTWQLARWTRVSPGRIGSAFLLVPPILLFLPLGSFGLFDSWQHGSVVLLSLGALILGFALGRDTAVPQPAEFWVYQKGLSLADWGITRWTLDAAFGIAVFLFWMTAWWIAAANAGETDVARMIAALIVWQLSLYAIISAILYAIGSTGSSRGTEFCVLLLFLALVQPLFARLMPEPATLLARFVLPPVLSAVDARLQIGRGEPLRTALSSLIHVGVYVTALLTVGTILLSRRRPEAEH